jgi:hypothetical protein
MSVTFNSVTLPLANVEAGPLARRRKVFEFPGNDGEKDLDMGLSGRDIVVRCVATSGSPSRASLEGLMDGEAYTLSADGDSYGECKCIQVGKPRKVYDASISGYREYYELLFRQVTPD